MPARYAAVDVEALLNGRATVRSGYAAREKVSCRLGEQDCGGTVRPFHACCPENTGCVSLSLNARCCDNDISDSKCTSALEDEPQCANPEHDLYDFDGHFCCEQGYKGYGNTDTEGDGCGTQDYVLKKNEKWLTIVVSGRAISSTTTNKTTGAPSATNPGNTSKTTSADSTNTSSTGTADATTTAASASQTPTVGGSPTTTAPSAGAPSSTDGATGKTSSTGAIAGGVVGGIAALALLAVLLWFLRKRKAKKSYASTKPQSPSGAYQVVEEGQGPEKDVPLAAMGKAASHHDGGGGGASELPVKDRGGDAAAAELYGQDGKRVAEMYSPVGEGPAEMYSPSVATTAELHGVERGPGELPAWDGRGVPGQLRVGEGRPAPVELP